MGKRQPRSYASWHEEVQYIRNIIELRDLSSFNWDLTCFNNYVQMQARFAEADGFLEMSKKMLRCIEDNK
jgi:hypothetical protein